MTKSIKKRSRRSTSKYPAIDVNLNLKTRYEEISDVASYFDTLPEDAKKWMHSFVEETINAKFDHKGKKIIRKVKDKRAIYNRNNARNRDVLTKAKACGKYLELDDPKAKRILTGQLNEDLLIAKLDYEAALKKKKNKRK